jgi:glycosidase
MFDVKEISNIQNGKKYKISINLPMNIGWIDYINFVVEKGNEKQYFPMKHIKNEKGNIYFETYVDLETRAIYNYYFDFKVNNKIKYITKDNSIKEHISREDKSKMSVNFCAPDWAKGKIMYHIFIDRFNRGSKEKLKEMPRRTIYNSFDDDMILGPNKDGIWNADFYGGDLLGIIEKLDYIRSLGVSIIYLSPVVHSQSNHRYDAADYENVDPYAGSNEDLKKLCDEAHEKGIKIVLDAVFNHTGNDSKYFNEYGTFDTVGAYQSMYSTYAPFYRKHYDNGNLWYDYWWGMPNLPVCNGYSREWQNYILDEGGVIDKWFNLGIDGLRLDVADELTDDFIEKIRIAVKRNKEDGFILGEVWKNPMRMNRGYVESGKGMDSVMNYQLIDALIRYFKYCDINKLDYIIKDILCEYPKDTINTLMNFTSTHDISRAINIFSSNDFNGYSEWAWNLNNNDLEWCKNFKLSLDQHKKGQELYKAYTFALTFLPGILSIFYGDEIGLEGIGNLANRKPFPWGKENKELLEYFRYLGNIRNSEKFLEEANLNILDINKNYFMFERENENESVLVTVNRTDDECKINIPSFYEKSDKVYTLKKSNTKMLDSYGAFALKKE